MESNSTATRQFEIKASDRTALLCIIITYTNTRVLGEARLTHEGRVYLCSDKSARRLFTCKPDEFSGMRVDVDEVTCMLETSDNSFLFVSWYALPAVQ